MGQSKNESTFCVSREAAQFSLAKTSNGTGTKTMPVRMGNDYV